MSLVFIILAAICKAVADTIAHHYDTSIFRGKKFFNPEIQGKKLPFTNYPFDGWHVANSLMIFFFCLAVFWFTWKLLLSGALFIIVFNLFYNKILR
jgi:hypothetical protein